MASEGRTSRSDVVEDLVDVRAPAEELHRLLQAELATQHLQRGTLLAVADEPDLQGAVAKRRERLEELTMPLAPLEVRDDGDRRDVADLGLGLGQRDPVVHGLDVLARDLASRGELVARAVRRRQPQVGGIVDPAVQAALHARGPRRRVGHVVDEVHDAADALLPSRRAGRGGSSRRRGSRRC